ncbi:transposase [Deinococcus sp. SL84]|nr:transposase [Deinococcus sp. SL84]MCY1703892.1 transposase [Deinococcus sp. SL84]
MILEPLFPPVCSTGRPRKWSWRNILNGIFYVLRGGIAWRLMPHDLPPWQTVYHYHRLWRKQGLWKAIHAVLRERVVVREILPHRPHFLGGWGTLEGRYGKTAQNLVT